VTVLEEGLANEALLTFTVSSSLSLFDVLTSHLLTIVCFHPLCKNGRQKIYPKEHRVFFRGKGGGEGRFIRSICDLSGQRGISQ